MVRAWDYWFRIPGSIPARISEIFFPLKLKRLALWRHLLSRKVSGSRNLEISCECKWKGRGRFEIWKRVLTRRRRGKTQSSGHTHWLFQQWLRFFSPWKATKHLFGCLCLAPERKRSRSSHFQLIRLGLRRCNTQPCCILWTEYNLVSKVGKCGMKIILSKCALDLDSSSNFHDQIGRPVHWKQLRWTCCVTWT